MWRWILGKGNSVVKGIVWFLRILMEGVGARGGGSYIDCEIDV